MISITQALFADHPPAHKLQSVQHHAHANLSPWEVSDGESAVVASFLRSLVEFFERCVVAFIYDALVEGVKGLEKSVAEDFHGVDLEIGTVDDTENDRWMTVMEGEIKLFEGRRKTVAIENISCSI